MVGHQPREPRCATHILARMRTDAGWSDVTIGNASRRGLMLRCRTAPPRGTFVELRCRNLCFVARVVWSSSGRCGVRTQDPVDLKALLGLGGQDPGPPGQPSTCPPDRPVRPPQIDAVLSASRRASSLVNWLFVALAGSALAATLAHSAANVFRSAASAAESALAGGRGRP